MSDMDDDELASELAEFAPATKAGGRSPREERIIAGFEEIQRFFEKHNRAPRDIEGRDIFERLYAVRLDRLRTLEECRSILLPMDHQGLLTGEFAAASTTDELDDDELSAELEGVEESNDITKLRNVRSSVEKREAEEIANREKCLDFDKFKPLFQQVQADLDSGIRTTRPFVKDAGFQKADIKVGQFYILNGQIVYIAEVGEPIRAPNGSMDARLRVIYSNGTESDLLLRSLQRALYKDEAGRRISDPVAGPLFASDADEGDNASGTIYVLRSKSDHPTIAANRNVLHKIGVTGGSVEKRIANARLDPTFLMADVEIVATYKLYNINRSKLENLIHRIFSPARVEIEIKDRFGQPIVPREWFMVPLHVVDSAIEKIKDGTITEHIYDPNVGSLVIKSS